MTLVAGPCIGVLRTASWVPRFSKTYTSGLVVGWVPDVYAGEKRDLSCLHKALGNTQADLQLHGAVSRAGSHSRGGVVGGRVIGASDRQGAWPTTDVQTPEDFAATIYDALGIPRTTHWEDALGRPHQIYYGQPIAGLT